MKDDVWVSDDDGEDVVVDVESSSAVGADIEDLGKAEFIRAIHAEVARDKDQNAAGDRTFLDVGVHVGILDAFEAEGLYFFCDAFESCEGLSGVGHVAVVLVEVDESLSLFPTHLHGLEVLFQEQVGDFGRLHLQF